MTARASWLTSLPPAFLPNKYDKIIIKATIKSNSLHLDELNHLSSRSLGEAFCWILAHGVFVKLFEGCFPNGSVVKNPSTKAGDKNSIPDPEDPTCLGAIKPVRHNYWGCALEPWSHNYWGHRCSYWRLHALEPLLHKISHSKESLLTAVRE